MLRAILYISDSVFEDKTTKQEQLNDIRNISKKANSDQHVSGVLAYDEKKFFHILEGESDVIDHLLEKITNDKRNENLSVLLDFTPEKRIYDDWNLIDSHSKEQSQLLSQFLQQNIDMLPMLEQQQHDNLESFVGRIFY